MKTSFILFILSCFILSGCSETKKQDGEYTYIHTQGEIFRTTANIKYHYHQDLNDEIYARLDSFNLSLNPFVENSIISKVNRNEDVEVDDWFMMVFNKSMEVSEMTDGAFDITTAPLVNLWGFGFEKQGDVEQISQQMVDSIKEFVGYKKIRLEGRKVIKEDPRTQLNASAIAKGYACDVVADLFDELGIEDYMVEIGGEVHAKGKNPNGDCWKIGVTKPVLGAKSDEENMETVTLCNKSLATSGNYRNYYEKGGKRYAHTINPTTGYPSENEILSVTIIHPECILADAYATAFMAMGLEEAQKKAAQIDDMNCLFIYLKDGEMAILER